MKRIIMAALAAAALAGLAACGSAAPSAQCRSQFHQVGWYQSQARSIVNSDVVVSNGSIGQFNSDVNASGRLLKAMKSEGCPDGGY